MAEYYNIKTVGDLIEELNKFDRNMPVMHRVIAPMDIARVIIQDVNEYDYGGIVKRKYKAVVIR